MLEDIQTVDHAFRFLISHRHDDLPPRHTFGKDEKNVVCRAANAVHFPMPELGTGKNRFRAVFNANAARGADYGQFP